MIDPGNVEQLAAGLSRFGLLDAVVSKLEGELEGVHAVGGTVRDVILERDPTELDLVVEGDPFALADRVGNLFGGSVVTHPGFATATVATPIGNIDIAGARAEVYPSPGALPVVEPATLEVDLERRDFTVNAIAVALGAGSRWAVRSNPRSLEDLASRRLRVLHERSFLDDPTRIWRLARYSGRLGFDVEPGTLALARSAIAAGALDTVSGDRSGHELTKLLSAGEPDSAVFAAEELGLLAHVGASAPDERIAIDALDLIGSDVDVLRVRLVSCYAGCRSSRSIGVRLGLGREASRLIAQAEVLPELVARLAGETRRSRIRAAFEKLEPETVAVAGASGLRPQAVEWFSSLSSELPLIDGTDLLDAGLSPGPDVAAGLARALELQLDQGVTDRTQLIEAAVLVGGEGSDA